MIEQVQCDPKEKAAAIRDVLVELSRYQGEWIVAHEHPLHDAVVRLESFCIKRRDDGKQPYMLWATARRLWYSLLQASRSSDPPDYIKPYAIELAAELTAELVRIGEAP